MNRRRQERLPIGAAALSGETEPGDGGMRGGLMLAASLVGLGVVVIAGAAWLLHVERVGAEAEQRLRALADEHDDIFADVYRFDTRAVPAHMRRLVDAAERMDERIRLVGGF